jgi:hypothetical protein
VDPPLLSVDEVSVGVSLIRLLQDRELVADRIFIRDAELTVERSEDGSWLIQNVPLEDLIGSRAVSAEQTGEVTLDAQDIRVHYRHPGVDDAITFTFDSIEARRDDELLAVDALVEPPAAFGLPLKVSASQRKFIGANTTWQFFLEGNSQNLAEWAVLQPEGQPSIESGLLDVSLWLKTSAEGLQSATANVVLYDFRPIDVDAGFGASGTVEFTHASDGWLLAASSFSLDLATGDAWPQSSWQVQAGMSAAGETQTMSVGASYLRLQDLHVLSPWLPEQWQDRLVQVAADGVVRDFSLSRSALDTDEPAFEIAARMEAAGMAAVDSWPGLRGFTGAL